MSKPVQYDIFSNHRQSHCVVSLSKTLYTLLSTGSNQEDPSRPDWKIVDWYIKNQNKETKIDYFHVYFRLLKEDIIPER